MFKSLRVEERQEYLEYPTGGWNTLIQGTHFLCKKLRSGPSTESFLASGDLEYSKFLNSFLK